MMMDHEALTLTAESAVTFNQEYVGQLAKYRAVEQPFTHEIKNISFIPGSSSTVCVDLNESRKTTTITRLPPARAEAAPRSPSDSPRCPEKPCFLAANTSFLASEANYEKVKDSVERALMMLEDYDWSYFENECAWKCKYFQGSNLRELHVYCYWDSRNEDHILEVKRVRGDGINPASSVDFFSKLKSEVTNTQEDCSHAKRGKLRGPLPLPMLGSTSSTSSLPLPRLSLSRSTTSSVFQTMQPVNDPNSISEEQFLSGLKPIQSMSSDQFYEPRLEASKMLCDLATKEKKFLELKECHELCLKSLDALLLDDFDDVKQFAVMAFASFAEFPLYQKSFLELRALESLVHLINNCPREIPSYHSAQMRRKAAIGLSLLARAHPNEMREVLVDMGYETEQAWLDHCGTILDKRTREAAMSMSKCFSL
mmetsp:Transcript_4438/g.4854  ORF Transcript_4438/g.4854 Transcript_4438/m.4854 type:complete len:425 (+) Transcript_4438:157-1431(+)